jgi:hypothetical protein
MDRLFAGEERLEGRTELLFAEVPVELLERVPVGVGQARFHRWPLRPDGTLDKNQVMEAAALAMPALPPLEKTVGNVIDAAERFNRRRHKASAQWEPSKEQRRLLVAAMRKSGMAARLADLACGSR